MRIKLMGCWIDNLTMTEALIKIDKFISSKNPHQNVAVNVDKIVKANKNPELMKIINRCDLSHPDGMPIVWASRILRKPLKERVTGFDLFVRLVERASQKKWRVFFLGAKKEIIDRMVFIFKEKYPGLIIVGYRDGYWTEEEEPTVVEMIKEAKPDILFVAISSPRKELFMSKYSHTMQVPFSMGVGGSFDVMTGHTDRAPVWMQKIGLEWFYRFLLEPKRMFKRYFLSDPFFLFLFFKEIIKKGNAQ